jgi:NADPH-dependent ferric siderophore reductase
MTDASPRRVERVRHERAYRIAEVVAADTLTPRMRRVVLASAELADFRSEAYDDHIRLFLPPPGSPIPRATRGPNGLIFPPDAPRPLGRDYTPRAFDRTRNRLTVDFVLHGEGPGSTFGERAKPGDAIGVAGPVSSMVVRGAYDWFLLIGDETALPAIGRRIEELPAGSRVIAFVEIADRHERQTFTHKADLDIRWLERNAAGPAAAATLLLDSVRAATLPEGVGFSFVACENTAARALRRHLVEERGLNADLVKAYRFWQRGAPDLGQSGG